MRKNREQQKNLEVRQLELFEDLRKPVHCPRGSTGKDSEPGVELLSQLERQHTLTVNLMEEVMGYGNLQQAYFQVRKNKGSGGVDRMEIEELGQWLVKNMEILRSEVLGERYQVQPVRKVSISKPDGGERLLGIPTVRDRMIQQAIHQTLNRYYDPLFSDNSYGFRKGRNAHQAIKRACEHVKSGKEWVVDIDLEKFFDEVNHDRLMQRLSKGIGDKRLLRLTKSYLRAGIMIDGLVEQRISGTPQGSPLSPLLSNIVLDELDKELERRGHNFCRYADDCNIYVSSKKAGERVMTSMIKFIEQKLKLKVNRQKSGVRHCSETKFLGYTLLPGGDIRISNSSIERLKGKVREITRRNRGVNFEQVISELNTLITGWTNYFHMANRWLADLRSIDEWIRRKLRCYRLKQCGRKYTTVKFLRNLNVPETTSWNVVMYSQGWWAMSRKQAVGTAMGIQWFARQGLLSIFHRIERS